MGPQRVRIKHYSPQPLRLLSEEGGEPESAFPLSLPTFLFIINTYELHLSTKIFIVILFKALNYY